MKNSKDKHSGLLTTILNGSLTELTEDEIALLFDYRTSDEENQREIQELIKNIKA